MKLMNNEIRDAEHSQHAELDLVCFYHEFRIRKDVENPQKFNGYVCDSTVNKIEFYFHFQFSPSHVSLMQDENVESDVDKTSKKKS